LKGLLSPFYHNSAPVNREFWQALGDGFIDTEAKVLFTFCIVLRKGVFADSSIPKFAFTTGLSDNVSLCGEKTWLSELLLISNSSPKNGLIPKAVLVFEELGRKET
jgi:hypothetical protein